MKKEMTNEERLALVCEILNKHEHKPSNLIAILQEIQEIYTYLPEEIMMRVAKDLGIPSGKVFGVATFYSHFTLEPKGKYVIKVCDGTACHVKKSGDIIKMLEKELGLGDGKITSADMLFTLEVVACLGVCGIAPVIVINEDVYGSMTVEKTKTLLEKIKQEEKANV